MCSCAYVPLWICVLIFPYGCGSPDTRYLSQSPGLPYRLGVVLLVALVPAGVAEAAAVRAAVQLQRQLVFQRAAHLRVQLRFHQAVALESLVLQVRP